MVGRYVRLTSTNAISHLYIVFERLFFTYFPNIFLSLWSLCTIPKCLDNNHNQNRITIYTNTPALSFDGWWKCRLQVPSCSAAFSWYCQQENARSLYIFIIIIKDPSKQSHLICFICYYYYAAENKKCFSIIHRKQLLLPLPWLY